MAILITENDQECVQGVRDLLFASKTQLHDLTILSKVYLDACENKILATLASCNSEYTRDRLMEIRQEIADDIVSDSDRNVWNQLVLALQYKLAGTFASRIPQVTQRRVLGASFTYATSADVQLDIKFDDLYKEAMNVICPEAEVFDTIATVYVSSPKVAF